MKAVLKNGIRMPQLPRHLNPETLARLEDEEIYSQLLLIDLKFGKANCAHVAFEQIDFRRVEWIESHLTGLRMVDSRLERCDASMADWEGARLQRVAFDGCRMIGAKLIETSLEDVLFKECAADHANFALAGCRAVRFEKCNLRETSFAGADLRNVVFHECDLSGADFHEARLNGADFRTSIINGLRVGIKELQGVVIAPIQAIQVVSLLGIQVREIDSEDAVINN